MKLTSEISVFNQDCMEGMSQYKDKYFDLAIVDPPYGINVNISMGRRKGDKKSEYHKFYGNDSSPPDKLYFDELMRISKNQIIWGANHFISKIPYDPACWIIWDKRFSDKVSFAQFEMAWTNFSSVCKKFESHPNIGERIHPTQKPISLYRWLFENYAKHEMKIIDTHLGSGSSAIAADQFGVMEFVGYELDKYYFDLFIGRFKKATSQGMMFKHGNVSDGSEQNVFEL